MKHRWSADREDARLYRTGRERHRQLGRPNVFGEAPDGLTFVFGERPVFVVRGREKRPAA